MAWIEFRFYEELNDFLAPQHRRRSFPYTYARGATVKNAIEAVGVPHTEVEVILVNGGSVNFSHLLRDGDRVSVYPEFEAMDIRPLLRVRAKPLRVTRFIADAHLGRLAKYLRLLGFDTLYDNHRTDAEIVRIAVAERRIVLTRDRDLLMHRALTHGIYVRSLCLEVQLRDVLHRADLFNAVRPFTRCLCCNESLKPTDKSTVAHRLSANTLQYYDSFYTCPACERIYWAGSHYRRLRGMVDKISALRRQSAAGRSN